VAGIPRNSRPECSGMGGRYHRNTHLKETLTIAGLSEKDLQEKKRKKFKLQLSKDQADHFLKKLQEITKLPIPQAIQAIFRSILTGYFNGARKALKKYGIHF